MKTNYAAEWKQSEMGIWSRVTESEAPSPKGRNKIDLLMAKQPRQEQPGNRAAAQPMLKSSRSQLEYFRDQGFS